MLHDNRSQLVFTGISIHMKGMAVRLLQLALQHMHVFECWHTVWNMYLKKKPGNPQIDLLRMLYLFKADYNLLLKWHSSKGFMARAEHNKTLHDSQGRG